MISMLWFFKIFLYFHFPIYISVFDFKMFFLCFLKPFFFLQFKYMFSCIWHFSFLVFEFLNLLLVSVISFSKFSVMISSNIPSASEFPVTCLLQLWSLSCWICVAFFTLILFLIIFQFGNFLWFARSYWLFLRLFWVYSWVSQLKAFFTSFNVFFISSISIGFL